MSAKPTLIGVISDTHGLLDEKVLELFRGVRSIIHAGDIGREDLIWQLEGIAPVVAVRGNNDPDTMCFPNERMALIEGRTFYVRHIFTTVEKMTGAQQRIIERHMPDAVIYGHSHKAYSGTWRGTLLFNPGSAGPKRFSLPRTVGLLEITEESITPRIISLESLGSLESLESQKKD